MPFHGVLVTAVRKSISPVSPLAYVGCLIDTWNLQAATIGAIMELG